MIINNSREEETLVHVPPCVQNTLSADSLRSQEIKLNGNVIASGEDGTITLPAMSYTTFNKKWADSLAEQKEIQEELSQTTTQNQKKNALDKK